MGLGFLVYTRLSPIVLSSRSLGRTAGDRRHCPHNKGGLAFQSSMATVRGKGWQNDSTGFTFHCKRFEYKAQLWKFSLEKVQCSVWAKRGSEKREEFSTKLTPETNRQAVQGEKRGNEEGEEITPGQHLQRAHLSLIWFLSYTNGLLVFLLWLSLRFTEYPTSQLANSLVSIQNSKISSPGILSECPHWHSVSLLRTGNHKPFQSPVGHKDKPQGTRKRLFKRLLKKRL